MEGPRPPSENEFPNVVRFLDSHLRPRESWSIASEYPVAFAESNRANIRIITDKEQVLAHAVIRPMVVKSPAGLFKVAGLGSVVTSTEHRNRGLSSKTIESCLEAAAAQGCDFAILWTDIHDFYRKFDFELAGSELSCLINKDLTSGATDPSTPPLKFIDGNRVAAEAIHRLYGQHTVTSLRTIDETRKYLQIPNSRVYTAWDQRGTLKAYAIEGKGADLNSYVHEWGGGVTALLDLFTHIRATQGRDVTVIIPRHSQNLQRALQGHGLHINHGYLGMIKILNPESVIAKINKYARNLGIQDFVFDTRIKDNSGGSPTREYLIGTKTKAFSTTRENEIVRLVFGPDRASRIHDFGTGSAIIEKVLPIPMWVWGWDSV